VSLGRRLFKALGPGLITGASDDDPTALATYAQAEAAFGYSTLWTALVSYPLMAAVQFICAKIGLVCGLGLSSIIRRHYSRWLLYPVVVGLLIANTINIGADLGAIAAGIDLEEYPQGDTKSAAGGIVAVPSPLLPQPPSSGRYRAASRIISSGGSCRKA
jgi:Mn2+/Fe2+ NRAMP family transporter